MGAGNLGWDHRLVCRALAGIETGVLGGLVMFGVLAAGSLVDFRTPWVLPNLLGSALNGHPALDASFGWVTVSGLGLHVLIAGLIGIVFGIVAGASRRRLRVTLLGILVGLCWHFFSQAWFASKLGVLVTVYSPSRPFFLAHLAYGIVLGWFPGRLRALERAWGLAAPLEMHETPHAPGGVEQP
jgi:hypothetical protein